MAPTFRLGVVAAEPSGDRLGGGVISALKARLASLELRGIGGPELANLGLESACDIHDLSVMAVEDLIRKLPSALRVRRQLLRDFRSDPPDLFLGIDSPDFNLNLEILKEFRHELPAGTVTHLRCSGVTGRELWREGTEGTEGRKAKKW